MTALDPRTKLALGFMGIVAVLVTQRTSIFLVESSCLCLGLLFLRTRSLGKILKLIGPLVILVFGIGLISLDYQTALRVSLRLANLLGFSALWFQGMKPEELGDAIRKLRIPYEWSFILATAIRYVPLIGRRIRGIAEAQRSRGIDLRPRPKNIPNFMALLMPLLIQSFVLSEELAMAMESRGFARPGRTFRREYRISPKEYVLMGLCVVAVAALTWWEQG